MSQDAAGAPLQAVAVLTMWFADVDAVGLVLPDGWFGRPHDTMLTLSRIDLTDDGLVIELDGMHTLTFAGPVTAEETADGVVLRGFTELTWDWREYGDDAGHRDRYADGVVEFVGN